MVIVALLLLAIAIVLIPTVVAFVYEALFILWVLLPIMMIGIIGLVFYC